MPHMRGPISLETPVPQMFLLFTHVDIIARSMPRLAAAAACGRLARPLSRDYWQ